MKINAARLQKSMEEMAQIGATPGGGVHRLTLSDSDKMARDLFAGWSEEAGLSVSVDEMGNMFARRTGMDESAPPVMAGSHLDSVPEGGRFDGSLGMLAALEVVRSLNDQGISTRHPIEIVNWTNEEGPRFPPSMLGSGVFSGIFQRDWAYGIRDADGKKFYDELERIGYLGDLPCQRRPITAYVELHIEQGPILITEGKQIGIVEGIRGLTWLRITMKGERDHAGPTPMHMRRDALVGAARVISAVREIPGKLDPDLVVTVGEVNVSPNAINVIPGQVTFSVDIRHEDEAVLKRAEELILQASKEAANWEGLDMEVDSIASSSPMAFDAWVTAAIDNACMKEGCTFLHLWSAAGHDARYAAELCPTAMIFTPSVGGKSHAEDELTTWEDVSLGCQILARTILSLAQQS